MPTAAKLVGTFVLAGLAYLLADLVGGHLREEMTQNALRPITTLFGLIFGWRFLGAKIRGDWRSAVGIGLTSVGLVGLCGLVWFSGHEMVVRATRMRYGGDPFLALEDMIQIAVDNLEFLGHPDVIGAAVIGGAVAGVIVTAVKRMFP